MKLDEHVKTSDIEGQNKRNNEKEDKSIESIVFTQIYISTENITTGMAKLLDHQALFRWL